MNNILTSANLEAGVRKWKNWKTKWDSDFHNGLYERLQQLKTKGLTQHWWQNIVNNLWDWRAIRPFSKETIYRVGLGCLRQLSAEYDRVLNVTSERELNLEIVSWEMLSGLYTIASSIKKVKHPSPVFGSKLCHFMLPNAFPVADREMIGAARDYRSYWRYCSTQWTACVLKQELTQYLERAIESEIKGRVTEHYPWATKIVELCIIGAKCSGQSGLTSASAIRSLETAQCDNDRLACGG